MKFSVIIPVYNGEIGLEDTVKSVGQSGLSDYEILLVDDGSTDGTWQLCCRLAQTCAQVRCVHQNNAGVSAARNYGLKEARGLYVLFVDADDRLTAFQMSDILAAVESEADMIVFGMDFQYYRKHCLVRSEQYCWPSRQTIDRQELAQLVPDLFAANYLSSVCNKFIRRNLIIENRLAFDPRLVNYEDLDFTVQVLQYTHSAVLLPEPYYQYICQYEQDHTVDRIAKLPDVIDNTDLIAETFFRYMAACPDCHRPQAAAICQVVLHIYIELLGYKIQRIPYREISGYLEDFCRDTYVQQCLKMVGEPVIRENRRLRWILERKALPIWLEKQYWRTRHAVARTGKLLLYQAGMRKSL